MSNELFRQLKGMLKSEYIQMKRNIFVSLVEILFPVILLFIFLLIRFLFKNEKEIYNDIYENDSQFILRNGTKLINLNSKEQAFFNNQNSIPYNFFLLQCQKINNIAIIGKVPWEIISKIHSHLWELNNGINFKSFNSVEDFNKYISSKEYGTDENNPKICFGISHIDDLKFGIHYSTGNIDGTNKLDEILSAEGPIIPDNKTNKNEKIRIQENFELYDKYKTSGYLMTMKIIYDYILQKVSYSNAEINFSVIPMKYDEISHDTFHRFLDLLGFFIIIGYSIPLSINIYKEIHFRETKKEEYLKSMGIKEIVFFISSFIKCFSINIFHSVFCALFAKLVLKQSQYEYLFCIFLLYGLDIFSMTYFFQSFLQESRVGVIISLLLYCVMSFFSLPMKSPIIYKPILYFICIVFPPTNLLLGFKTFYTFEKEYTYIDNRIDMDVSQIAIKFMIIFLFVSFCLYLILGVIVSSLFCYEYGINKKFCCSKKKTKVNNIKEITNEKKDGNLSITGFGDKYIENDEVEEHQQNVKNMYNDIMNSISRNLPKDIIDKKFNNLKKSMAFLEKNGAKEFNSQNINHFEDQCESDIGNQVDVQKMRNSRRTIMSTMYNIKPKKEYLKKAYTLNQINKTINMKMLNSNLGAIKENNNNKDENVIKIENNEIQKIEDNHIGSKLKIKNIIKRYNNSETNALDSLSFNAYENEIFVLLGQNGAGKSTFISILSGLIEADSGSIIYGDENRNEEVEVVESEGNKKFRKILGVCPQNNNILFDDLTVKENLEIFCLFKYEENKKEKEQEQDKEQEKNKSSSNEKLNIEAEIKKLIDIFELEDFKDKLVKNLSGGLKRRLAIAIACCGRSKVIILDEPTGGVDLLSRKKIWNILNDLKNLKDDKKKIIILITHFMDEASFLADQIGILKNGKLLCCGTTLDLIIEHGKYITIQINKKPDEKSEKFLNFINDNFIKKEKDSSKKEIIDTNFNLPFNNTNNNLIDNHSTDVHIKIREKSEVQTYKYKEKIVVKIPTNLFNFTNIYDNLKTLEDEYKINNYQILKDQLEDVFNNLIREKSNFDDDNDFSTLLEKNKSSVKKQGFQKFKNDLKLLIKKRFYETLRDKKSFILEILFPILLTIIACLATYSEFLEQNLSYEIKLDELDISKNKSEIIFYEPQRFDEYYFIDRNLKNYHFLKLENHFHYDTNYNIVSYLEIIHKYCKNNNIKNNYASYYVLNDQVDNFEYVSFVSTKKRHSSIIYNNYFLKRIIAKNVIGSEYDINKIGIVNSPFPITYKEKENRKSRNGLTFVFYISIALSLIPSNFITIIVREKENKSKQLQLLSGLSIYTFWINNYIFELIKYYVVVGICLIILVCFSFYEKYLAVLYVFYGPALVSFTYVLSYFLDSEGSAQTSVLLINLFFGSLCGSAVLILRTNENLKNLGIALSIIFRLVPSFCICYGFNELISQKLLFAIDYYNKNSNDLEEIRKKYNDPSNIIKDPNYITLDIIFLAVEIFLYTGLLIFLENKDYFLWKLGFRKKRHEEQNLSNTNISEKSGDFREQIGGEIREVINQNEKSSSKGDVFGSKNKNNYPLQVSNLRKSFYNNPFNICYKEKKLILNNISFKVENGSCFGLLGGNSAGKTTSFRCLCKELEPDSGSIKIDDEDIYDYSNTNKRLILGYCPQFDSTFEYLTVKQNLFFYGKLKEIDDNSLETIVNIIIKKLNLTRFTNKMCKDLSGGNKRKLSVGIAIISKPSVILMDEPSTGMDPYTRILLSDLLYKAYLKNDESDKDGKRAVVLTTHSIEEAEALCDNVGILVSGNFNKKVTGRICDILKKESNGIELIIEFKKPSLETLIKKYGNVLKEEITNFEELKRLLQFYKKENYIQFFKKDHLGKDLLKILVGYKKINKFTILRWVEYMDYLCLLVSKIKKYFSNVTCIYYKINNYILRIYNDPPNDEKCDSFIFGIVEEFQDQCCIEEYTYTLTTFESVFIKCIEKKEKEIENNIEGKDKKLVNIIL